jgi:hypothetical protein
MTGAQKKADELYDNALSLYGIEKAKHEALKSAEATLSLVPFGFEHDHLKNHWEKIIKHLEKK